MQTTFKITGMHCASCAVNIESELGKQPGVKSANVNYALATAAVEHEASVMDHDLERLSLFHGHQVSVIHRKGHRTFPYLTLWMIPRHLPFGAHGALESRTHLGLILY